MAGHSSAGTRIPAADADIIGSYPWGTLFEADVFYALQFQPRNTGSARGIASGSANVNNATTFIASNPTLRPSVSSQSNSILTAPRARPSGKRRFKPTLNCYQCVQRKTKCDRARPCCRACISRAQSCNYNQLAELLHAHNPPGRKRKRPRSLERNQGEDQGNAGPGILTGDSDGAQSSLNHQAEPGTEIQTGQAVTLNLPHLPFAVLEETATNESYSALDAPFPATRATDTSTNASNQTSGLDHDLLREGRTSGKGPASGTSTNHWLHSGDLGDVIRNMLLLRGQADALLDVYCNIFDPVNPVLNTVELTKHHEDFWTTPARERANIDPVQFALLMAVYACAAQQSSRTADRDIVESCLSTCHRALCVSQYLRFHSLQRCEALFLMCQCLINDSREREAWTLAGLNQRQAIGLGLDSSHVQATGAAMDDQWQKTQLWAALLHQDNVLSCIMKVPRSVSSAVIHREDILRSTDEAEPEPELSKAVCDHRYHMALNSIAEAMHAYHSKRDSSCLSRAERSAIQSSLQATFHSFRSPFQNLDTFWVEQQTNSRVARQGIELMCIYHFHMTLASASTDNLTFTGDSNDHHLVIDSLHDSLAAFFSLAELAPSVRGSWSLCHTLSYLQAVKVGSLLSRASSDGIASSSVRRRDPMLILAKSDFDRFIERFVRMMNDFGSDGIQSERLRELRDLRRKIRVV